RIARHAGRADVAAIPSVDVAADAEAALPALAIVIRRAATLDRAGLVATADHRIENVLRARVAVVTAREGVRDDIERAAQPRRAIVAAVVRIDVVAVVAGFA